MRRARKAGEGDQKENVDETEETEEKKCLRMSLPCRCAAADKGRSLARRGGLSHDDTRKECLKSVCEN